MLLFFIKIARWIINILKIKGVMIFFMLVEVKSIIKNDISKGCSKRHKKSLRQKTNDLYVCERMNML